MKTTLAPILVKIAFYLLHLGLLAALLLLAAGAKDSYLSVSGRSPARKEIFPGMRSPFPATHIAPPGYPRKASW